MIQDLRYAVRGLRRSPGFTAVAVLTLGLGIGATVAIFGVVDSIALNPLPYEEPERLVWIDSRVSRMGPDAAWGVSEVGYFYFREQSRTLEEVGAFTTGEMNLADPSGARRAQVALVTASLLDVLRARPAAGRLIEPEDDVPNGGDVAVLGYEFWRREYAADPGVVGSTIQLHAVPRVVLGVMAPGLQLPDRRVDVWVPLGLDPARPPVNAHWLQVVGRLEPGRTVEAAERELAGLTARFPELFPRAYYAGFMENYGFATRVLPLRDFVIGGQAAALWILLAAVGLVLLIACANVAHLFLVRAETRRREFAIRDALGAGRARLARHGLAESLVVATLAGGLGLFLADSGLQVLLALGPTGLPRLREIGLDGSSLAFAVAVSLAAGVVFGLFPLLRARGDYAAIRDAGVGLTASRGRHRLRRLLVVSQVAFAVVLLASAGLLLRSHQRLRSVEPGFDPANVLTMELRLPAIRYRAYGDVLGFYRELVSRVETLPGTAAAAAGRVPLKEMRGCALVFIEGRPVPPGERPPCVGVPVVTPGYFDALGIPVRGRAPDWSDIDGSTGAVVVTAGLARRLWPGEDPIGKGIKGNGSEPPFYRVVGVAGDLRAEGLDRPPTEAVFFPIVPFAEGAPLWGPYRSLTLVVKTHTERPDLLTGGVRRILDEIDPTIPIGGVQTMESIIAGSDAMARVSFTLLLLGIAGGMALVLSMVGLYGVLSYMIGTRRAEIGIRMALGARAEEVAGMVVRESLALTAGGLALGLAAALAGGRLIRALLYDVSPADPLALAAAALLLAVVAATASLLPARRAARVEPMAILRYE